MRCDETDGSVSVLEAPRGFDDGDTRDRDGNLWTTRGQGIDVHASDGSLIGRIPVPESVSSPAFGGRKRDRLFVTAQTSLHALSVDQHAAG